MGNDNFLCNRKPEACAGLSRLVGGPEERFKDVRKILGGDPDACVCDLEADEILLNLRSDIDPASGRGIFQRI